MPRGDGVIERGSARREAEARAGAVHRAPGKLRAAGAVVEQIRLASPDAADASFC